MRRNDQVVAQNVAAQVKDLAESSVHQKLVLFGSERDDGQAAHSHQRRRGEEFVGFDFGEGDGLGQFFARRESHLRVLRIRDFDRDDGRCSDGAFSVASFVDDQTIAGFHFAKISERNRIVDAVPHSFLIALQIGEGIFRRFSFQ